MPRGTRRSGSWRHRTRAGGSRGSRSRSSGSSGARPGGRVRERRSSRRGGPGWSRASSDEVHGELSRRDRGGADDHVHAVALAEALEPVEHLARMPVAGPRSRSGPRSAAAWSRGAGRSARRSRRVGRRAVLDRDQHPHVGAEQDRPAPAVTFQTTRSGGTSPIRNVMPIASIRKTRTRRRRSRDAGPRRSASPTKRAPFRGVTIQRPVVPFTSACAKNSILRSKSSTELAVERASPAERVSEMRPT